MCVCVCVGVCVCVLCVCVTHAIIVVMSLVTLSCSIVRALSVFSSHAMFAVVHVTLPEFLCRDGPLVRSRALFSSCLLVLA